MLKLKLSWLILGILLALVGFSSIAAEEKYHECRKTQLLWGEDGGAILQINFAGRPEEKYTVEILVDDGAFSNTDIVLPPEGYNIHIKHVNPSSKKFLLVIRDKDGGVVEEKTYYLEERREE